jgi:PleD family two-component response regulator
VVRQKTASFGVATYRPDDQAKDIVARADAALYRAKDLGRNRVEWQ